MLMHWRDRYRKSVRAHGAAAVSRVVKMHRATVVSVCAGLARESTDLLAESRVDLLDTLDAPKAARGERAP